MTLKEQGLETTTFGGGWVATIRKNVSGRAEIEETLEQITGIIPADRIAGPPFWIRNFIHSYPQGFDAEIGLPVDLQFEAEGIVIRYLPEYEVLSRLHTGSMEQLSEAYQAVFQTQNEYGLISDEFCIEVLHSGSPAELPIEVLFVRHPWEALFGQAISAVMGEPARQQVIGEQETIFLETPVSDRFAWTKDALDRFDQISIDDQRFEVLTACSHVFPREQSEKMREVYLSSTWSGADLLKAVDDVVAFMEADPGWRPIITREGNTLYVTKNPANQEAYDRAETDLERKKAACFCPIIQQHIEDGMSDTFCYCSAGYERKQWEVALEQPVRIEVVKSLLKGDLVCQFAIHLPRE